jgi:alpha-glucosidase/alpha-D-xyloside xylohydrolase
VNRKYAELRYQLIPYTYTLAREAHDTGMPFMRALWLHFPEDERARETGSEYLWGPSLLIVPVFQEGARSRRLYLPEGVWYDWWTNDRETGGREVPRPVDLETMPIYVRAGAIIPFDPVRQYMEEVVDEPTTIKVFGGADGEFTLYEDDGISLDYLQDRGTWTRMTWDDGARILVMEPGGPQGAVNLLPDTRTFIVQLLPEGEIRTVEYGGTRVEVKF